jgi:hypothetical protein
MAFGDTCGMGSVCCPKDCNFQDLYFSICFERDTLLELNVSKFIDVTSYWWVHGVTAPPGELRNKQMLLEVKLVSKVFNPVNYTIDYEIELNGVYDPNGTPKGWRNQSLTLSFTFNCNAEHRQPIISFDRNFITNKDDNLFLADAIYGLTGWVHNMPNKMSKLPSQGGCQEAQLYYWGGWTVVVDNNTSAADIEVKYGWEPATQLSKGFVQVAGDKVWLEIETKASDDNYDIVLEWNPFYFCLDQTVTNPLSPNWNPAVYDAANYVTYVESPANRATRALWVYLTLVDRVKVDSNRILWDFGIPDDVMFNLIMKSGAYSLTSDIKVQMI